MHKKYHAKYYFCDLKGADAGKAEPIRAPIRTLEGWHSYNEYLCGLDKINQQEFVMPGKSGAKLNSGQFSDKNHMLNALPPKELAELALWERQIRNRSESINVMKFRENLLRRSRMHLSKPFEKCTDGIPIRRETLELLTRPPEPDYTVLAMIVLVASAANYWFAVGTQIVAIASVCAAPFFCPARSSYKEYPMIMPPALFRTLSKTDSATDLTFWSGSAPLWNPEVQQNKGGYRTDWPYYQQHIGPLRVTEADVGRLEELSKEIKLISSDECKVQTAEAGQYNFVYDPFINGIREEYLKCDKDETQVEVLRESGDASNPTASPYSVTTTFVTFNKKDYDTRRKDTEECMQERKKQCDQDTTGISCSANGAIQPDLFEWWTELKTRTDRSAEKVIDEVASCAAARAKNRGHTCDCSENDWVHYPVSYFNHREDTFKVCDTGNQKTKGEVCETDKDCSDDGSGKCVQKWPDSRPISTHVKYGCFFTAPTDSSESAFAFQMCNAAEVKEKGTIETVGGTLTRAEKALLQDVWVSFSLVLFPRSKPLCCAHSDEGLSLLFNSSLRVFR